MKLFLFQLIGALAYATLAYGTTGLYANMICIACSQVEKLKKNLSDIRQTTSLESPDNQTSQHMFQDMKKKLKQCIRHHQQILE